MPQDAFTLRLVAKELDRELAGGRVNRINQPEREEVSLLIYTGKRTVKLVVNVNASDCGVYFCDDDRENPPVARSFCMLLRKYLQGAEVLSVRTEGFERILRIRFLCRNEFVTGERELAVEVMGKYSNALLLEDGVILGAVKTTALDENCRRAVLAGVKYVLPLPQDKVNPSDYPALAALLDGPKDGHFLFTRVSGLAPVTAEQIAASYRGGDFARHVYDYIFSDDVSPCVVERGGIPTDFFARYAEGGIPYPTLSEAQTAFYRKRRAVKRVDGERRRLSSVLNTAIKKHEKRLGQIAGKERECEDCEALRRRGELLTANLWRAERGVRGCELEDWETGEKVKISLDPRLSPAENAQGFFKRYRKQKRTLEALAPQKREAEEELDYLRSLLAFVLSAETAEDLASAAEEMEGAGMLKKDPVPRKKAEIPYRSYEKEGFRILAGRNNLQNDRLLRAASPEDLWLHVRERHSCHAIVKTNGKEPPEGVLRFAAAVCAKYSDGKGDVVPVDCTRVKYVKKPPKAKAGFVTYTNFMTLRGDPKEVDE